MELMLGTTPDILEGRSGHACSGDVTDKLRDAESSHCTPSSFLILHIRSCTSRELPSAVILGWPQPCALRLLGLGGLWRDRKECREGEY